MEIKLTVVSTKMFIKEERINAYKKEKTVNNSERLLTVFSIKVHKYQKYLFRQFYQNYFLYKKLFLKEFANLIYIVHF